MGYSSLQACVADLARTGQLRVIDTALDGDLEVAAVQRRAYRLGGPALLFTAVRGSRFPVLANLYGTLERARYLFRDSFEGVRQLVSLGGNPAAALRVPHRHWRAVGAALHALPLPVACYQAPVLARRCALSELPAIRTWPLDGGPFVTLPQVYSHDPLAPGVMRSNLGMYRVQLAGNRYDPQREVGLHYQLHRGIGVHHAHAVERGQRLPVCVFVGGPPALAVAAVMPLPEGMPEVLIAGALGGRNLRLAWPSEAQGGNGLPVFADADFCILGYVDPHRTLPEGPFGDHLGYYSLTHEFPVLEVTAVYHRPDAIWPFTSVGRPPQEDTTFGQLVHELTASAIPAVLPGVHAVHAVDASGVHPLLLAVGSERYVPYAERTRPQELLTQASAILGQGQLSLAKYLLIVNREDAPGLDIHDVGAFLRHLLERIDWRRDLHFYTQTTIDTLDYSGSALNQGSKLVMAAVGKPLRTLATTLPSNLQLPPRYTDAALCMPGVMAVSGPPRAAEVDANGQDAALRDLCAQLGSPAGIALVVVTDDCHFAARSLDNLVWNLFTRSNPAADVHGVGASTVQRHWGCTGPLIIDARAKPHHAPPVEEDPAVIARLEALAVRGGPLEGLL
jgi:4-hydroxy-3-polyprenylbenzoate decarboxylase